jgi:bacillithiol biosynthesis cysteine-adding enzyme BshC
VHVKTATLASNFTYIDYRDTNSFSELVYDYIDGNEALAPFYAFEANRTGIQAAIEKRKQFPINRKALVEGLQQQYQQLSAKELVRKNIESLEHSQTFSICTAHQPNLLTGYLYFFYKILHAIAMAEQLNLDYPKQHFVPVYYMGSEDNDLAELGKFRYEETVYEWDANGQTGAVGRMSTESLKALLNKLFKRFGPPGIHCDMLKQLLEKSYTEHSTITSATQYLVHELFGQYGLVVLNPDEPNFKKQFRSIIKDELLHQHAYPVVSAQSQKLAQAYKAQAFPRPINLFYLKGNIRERIEKQAEHWQVLNTSICFDASSILEEIEHHPEHFSPNVILRGLFQESILPNVCFIGGGAELAYWLQLKPLFDYYNVFYPVIFLRQSVQIIEDATWQLMQKMNCSIIDIFKPIDSQIKQHIMHLNSANLNIEAEQAAIDLQLEQLVNKAQNIDSSLEQSIGAARQKIKHQINVVAQKMYRAEKRKAAIDIQRLEKIYHNIKPNGGLQERVENFSSFYLQNGFSIFDTIKRNIKPFDNQFLIIHPEKNNGNEAL